MNFCLWRQIQESSSHQLHRIWQFARLTYGWNRRLCNFYRNRTGIGGNFAKLSSGASCSAPKFTMPGFTRSAGTTVSGNCGRRTGISLKCGGSQSRIPALNSSLRPSGVRPGRGTSRPDQADYQPLPDAHFPRLRRPYAFRLLEVVQEPGGRTRDPEPSL